VIQLHTVFISLHPNVISHIARPVAHNTIIHGATMALFISLRPQAFITSLIAAIGHIAFATSFAQ